MEIRWRAAVGKGHSSPIVSAARVYLTDVEVEGRDVWERAHCFDEKTGERLWTYRDRMTVTGESDPENPPSPCATPIVEEDRLVTLGVTGNLRCLDAATGAVLWRRDLGKDYDLIEPPNLTPSPLIDGELLILVIGGKPGACVVALDKRTGEEAWRALDDPPRAFSSPILVRFGGEKQLIVWTPRGVTSLDPSTGRTWWREEIDTREDYAGASPVFRDGLLLVSGLMLRMDRDRPAASVLWPERRTLANRVLSNTCMPLIRGGLVYAGNMTGQLVCLDAGTGEEAWKVEGVTRLQKYASIHLTPNGDSVLVFTDEGNLLRARLEPSGYRELDRVHLIDPTFRLGGRKVVWAPPAYANSCVFARNGRELICASLAAEP